MSETTLTQKDLQGYFSLRGGDFEQAGASATALKGVMLRAGFTQDDARRAAVSTFEAEMNVIIHAVAGTLQYEVVPAELVIITVTDMGPGIPDVEAALVAGFSTAPQWAKEKGWGSGLGLPNIMKNSDCLEVDTSVGEGTTLKIKIFIGGRKDRS